LWDEGGGCPWQVLL
jgi:hypothetical protein